MTSFDPFEDDLTPGGGSLSGFMVGQQLAGASAREAIAAWREAGGTAGNQAFNRLYGMVGDAHARLPDMAAVDPGNYPSPLEYGTWAAGQGGQFATTVRVYMTDTDTGVQSSQFYTYFTNEPHTPAEAQAAAEAEYGSAEHESTYGYTVDFSVAVAFYQTVPYELAG